MFAENQDLRRIISKNTDLYRTPLVVSMSRMPQAVTQSAFTETPFFFANGVYRLFGILHRPPANAVRGRGFVFCYPCFEEKLWAHRVFVRLARELAALGFHVLRFDYMGHGDSDGSFEQSTVSSRLSDIACAVGSLRQEIGSARDVGLLGLRFGATLAACHAESDDQISNLILWDPLVDGAAYMQEVLLSNLATQSAVYQEIRHTRENLVALMEAGETVSIEGYGMSHQFYEQGSRLTIKGSRRCTAPCLLVQTGRAIQKPKKQLEDLCAAYPSAELKLCTEEPFWKESKIFCPRANQLSDATIAWIQAHVD